MTREITVPESVDDSKKLQKLIDSTGNRPAKFIFPDNGHIWIESLIRFYSFAEIAGNNSTWELMENAPTNPFGEQVPLVAPKSAKSAEGLCIHDVVFEGNRDNQAKVPKKNGKNWGLGYHNFIGLGTLSSIEFSNAVNCEFYNLEFNNSLGDGIRPEGATNIVVHDIKGKRTGHDTINYSAVNGGEVYNVDLKLGVGSGVRLRSCKNIKVHGCKLDNSMGLTYGPGIQIQSTAKNWISTGIEIYNNDVRETYGPGIQIAGSVPNNGLVSVHNNLFLNCGQMPASVGRSVVGGIAFDGFPVDIRYNTIVNPCGYGLVAGDYDVGSTYSFDATIYRNIIVGARKSYNAGNASGSGIANLLGSRYSIKCSENDLYDNLINCYNVTNSKGLSVNPLFIGSGDYHLHAASPCRFTGYQLGCYTDPTSTEGPIENEEETAKIIITGADSDAEKIIQTLSHDYTVYKRE